VIAARAIKTSRPFKSEIFRDEMTKAANVIRKDALADFKKTTANWKHKVTFASKVWVGGISKGIEVHVATDDVIYGYVDEGTRPHIIRAKTRNGLRFLGRITRGIPKTQPNVVGTFPGKAGTGWTRKMAVKHPGNKPRNFSKHIAKTTQKELSRETKNALARFTRRTGYEINK